MSENEKNVPKRRFKEFESAEAWEECKLGELGSVVMNRRIFKGQTFDEGDVPFYKIGTFGSEPDAFIPRDLFEEYKSKYPYPEKGDILLSASGSIGRIVEYMGKDEYFQDSNIVWLQHDNRVINSFLKQFYSVVKWSGLEGSTIKRLYNKNILDTPISLPRPKEQKKIGQFFIELDNLITLHQRKLEKMKALKKAYLIEMFPAEGECKPKLRFAGFTVDWEQRKLCKIADFSKGRGYSKNDLVEGGTPIILYGRLYTKYQTVISEVDTFALANNGSIYSTGNEVIVPASGETSEDIARASAVVKLGVLLGGDLNIIYPNDNINSIFLALAISNGKQQKELSKRAQGKSVVHLHNSDLKKLDIFYPSKKEQIEISSFFTDFDNLITLHQRKLDKLQNIKKAYLNEMFI
jgi:type I restriction enzyme S subunit